MSTVDDLRRAGWYSVSFKDGIPGGSCKWFMSRGSIENPRHVWGSAKDYDDALEQMLQVRPDDAGSKARKWTRPRVERAALGDQP